MYSYATRVSIIKEKSMAILQIANNNAKIFELKNYSKIFNPNLNYTSKWELVNELEIEFSQGGGAPSIESLARISEGVLPYEKLVLAGHTEGEIVPAKLFHSYLADNYKSTSYKICAYIEDSKLEVEDVFRMASSVYDKLTHND